jgi:hypothetical protein
METKTYEVLSLTPVFNQSRSDISNKYLNNFFTNMPWVAVSFHFRISKRKYVCKLKLPILWYSSLCRHLCKFYLWPWLWISKMWWPFEEKKNENIFLPIILGFSKLNCFSESSQASFTCPYGKSSMSVKTSMERWWKILRGKQKHLEKTYSIDTLSTTNITWSDLESNRGFAVSGRRLTAWAWQTFEEKK